MALNPNVSGKSFGGRSPRYLPDTDEWTFEPEMSSSIQLRSGKSKPNVAGKGESQGKKKKQEIRIAYDPSLYAPALETPGYEQMLLMDPVTGDIGVTSLTSMPPGLDRLYEAAKIGYGDATRPGVRADDWAKWLGPIAGIRGREGRAYFESPSVPIPEKMAMIAGSTVGHISSQWPFRGFVWNTHPNELMQSYGIPAITEQTMGMGAGGGHREMVMLDADDFSNIAGVQSTGSAGSSPRLPLKYWAPLTVIGSVATGVGSGNINLAGLFDPEEGPRVEGYVAPGGYDYDNPTQTTNYPMALLETTIGGGFQKPLKWNDFQYERPDITKQQYQDYMAYYYGNPDESEQEGDFALLGGLVKGTPENLEGVPELRVAGYRVTPAGILAGLGSVAGASYLMARNRNRFNRIGQNPALSRGVAGGEAPPLVM